MSKIEIETRPVTPEVYGDLKPFFEGQEHRLCVYSLSSIISWSSHLHKPRYAVISGRLVICLEYEAEHAEKSHMILPISPGNEATPEEVQDIAQRIGIKRCWFVPEDYLERHGRERVESLFHVKEQEELEDYVYLRDDLAELKGNKYSKKRNLINQFKRAFVSHGRVEESEIREAHAPECIDFLEEWCRERSCESDPDSDLSCEKQAAKNALTYIEKLGMKGIFLRVDGKVSAFAMSSGITNDMGALHFEKAFEKHKGLYQYLDNLCAKRLFNGYDYINKESDMGMPGLAKSKKSYHPSMMLKSYELTLR